jgi:hypothetical protein
MSSRLRRCFHESGHVVAALQLGIPIIRVTMADHNPHLRRDARYQPDTPVRARNLALLSLSGPMAEERFVGPITDDGDAIDRAKAHAYLARWRLDDEYDALSEQAHRLVRQWAYGGASAC